MNYVSLTAWSSLYNFQTWEVSEQAHFLKLFKAHIKAHSHYYCTMHSFTFCIFTKSMVIVIILLCPFSLTLYAFLIVRWILLFRFILFLLQF